MSVAAQATEQQGNQGAGRPGYVYHIPYNSLPVPEEELARYRLFLTMLVTDLLKARQLQALYMVHPLRLPPELWREGSRKFAVCWDWGAGQLVRLQEPREGQTPKKTQSEQYMEDLAKALPEQLGTVPAAMRERRVNTADMVHLLQANQDFPQLFPKRRWFSPLEVFLGGGGCELYLVENEDAFFRMGKALTIGKADVSLGALDFAVPVFTLEDFASALPEALETWFRLFEIYISENREDGGLLIASRHDIAAVIERAQTCLLPVHASVSV